MPVIVRRESNFSDKYYDYLTSDEIKFLNGIGKFCTDAYYRIHYTSTQQSLWRKYRDAMPDRVKWDAINKKEIEDHLDRLINDNKT